MANLVHSSQGPQNTMNSNVELKPELPIDKKPPLGQEIRDDWPAGLVDQLRERQQNILREKRHRLNHLNSQITLAKAQVNARTKQMARDLFEIYPINEFPDRRGYSICDIYLPNSEHLEGHDATMISVAAGYVGHLLIILSDTLDIALRFPIKYYGSKSVIYCNRRNQSFPLYVDSTKGKDWLNFSYGMSLLNLNILQLRTLYGLTTNDPGDTLANLHELKIILALDG